MKHNILLLLILIVSGFSWLESRNVYVYRNDNRFEQLNPTTSLILNHSIEGSDTVLHTGGTDIPVAAIDSIVIRQTDIPVLRFTFPDYPEAEWVTDKEKYIDATLDIDGNGSVESHIGLSLSVKGRGNSSWEFHKKPMRMKFSSKTSICGLRKAKSFVLLADFIDPSLMHNAVALWIAQKMGVDFANSFVPCHVYVNGKYAGAYLLTEKIGINKASVDIDDTIGVLMEMSSEFDEPYKFRSAIYNLPVMIKDPDFDELAETTSEDLSPADRLSMWESDFNIAEAEAVKLNVTDVFDLRSFVDYIIVYDIARNGEIGWPKSCYLYKEAPGKDFLYKFGPVWDFDTAFNTVMISNGVEVPADPEGGLWINPLFDDFITCPEFMPLFKDRFTYFETIVYPEFLQWFDSYVHTIEPLARMNGLRWPDPYANSWICRTQSSFDNVKNTAELKEWIQKRVSHIRSLLDQNRFR